MQEATLSVVTVNTVQPTFVQLNTFARVTISTFGSQPRDVVKFVPSAAECESAAYAEYLLGNQQVVNVLFTDASIEKYYLCYKPVDEAFTFLEVFSLTVRDDRNLIDFASTKHHFSVVGETEEYEIMEDNVAEGDRVMWSVDGCASSVADTTEMAVHDRKFTMTFGEVFANASLCMKFVGTRSWTEYPNQKLSVLSVFDVQPRVFTRDVAKVPTFHGFGLDDTTLYYLGRTCDASEEDRFSALAGVGLGYETCGFASELTATGFAEEAIESITLSKTYPEGASASVLFDNSPRTALSFATATNGVMDIVLKAPYVFTQVGVFAAAGPASPKNIKVYAVSEESMELLAAWTKENEYAWSDSPAFSKQATHFRMVFEDNYDASFNYIRVVMLRIYGFAPELNGVLSVVRNEDCSQVVASSTLSLCEPTTTVTPATAWATACASTLARTSRAWWRTATSTCTRRRAWSSPRATRPRSWRRRRRTCA